MSGEWAGRRIILGISGSVAAYKALEVASRLRQAGASLECVLTRGATAFVTPLSCGAVSGGPVHLDEAPPGAYGPRHLEILARNEAILVAPASANLLARAATGHADDLLTTLLLASSLPVLMAPAMESGMYAHPATQENIGRLRRYGYRIVPPEEGFLASGSRGVGRLASPEKLLEELAGLFAGGDLRGMRFLITAGPTREYWDPVRFVSNPSTGRMGYALAAEAARRGAEVVLVSGPSPLSPPAGVGFIPVESAEEMFKAVRENFTRADVFIAAAAVADHRPAAFSSAKLPKRETVTLELAPNPDILAWAGENKGRRLVVGFAAQTRGQEEEAWAKLRRKKADLMVLNEVDDPEAGFAKAVNRVRLLTPDGASEAWPVLAKEEVASRLLDRIRDRMVGR